MTDSPPQLKSDEKRLQLGQKRNFGWTRAVVASLLDGRRPNALLRASLTLTITADPTHRPNDPFFQEEQHV